MEETSAAESTPSVDPDPKLATAQKDLAASRARVERLRAEVRTCNNQIAYNRQWASVQYTRAVGDHQKTYSGNRHATLALDKRTKDPES